MKTTRLILILFIAAGILATACEDLLGDLLKFNTQWYTLEFSIDTTDQVGTVTFITEEFDADLDSVLEANSVSMDNISDARLSDAIVSILTPGKNFDPVGSLQIYIETPGKGSTLVAWLETVPTGVTEIVLDLTEDDLQEYLTETTFRATATGVLNSKVDEVVDLKADFRWLIGFKTESTDP